MCLKVKNPRIREPNTRINSHTLESMYLMSFHPRSRACPKVEKILDRKENISSMGHITLPLLYLLPHLIQVLLVE